MDKNTQLYVGIGAAAVVAYLLLKKKPTTMANYAGITDTNVVGRRQRADGIKLGQGGFNRPSFKTIYAPKMDSVFSADGRKPFRSMPYKPPVESLEVVLSADGMLQSTMPIVREVPPSVPAPSVKRVSRNLKPCNPMFDKNCGRGMGFRPQKSFFNVKNSRFGW